MNETQKEEAAAYYTELFSGCVSRVRTEPCDMLVLDEIMASLTYGFVREEEVLEFIRTRPEGLELVLTGRNPSETLTAAADYVSEIKMVRHPYVTEQLAAREGIEY